MWTVARTISYKNLTSSLHLDIFIGSPTDTFSIECTKRSNWCESIGQGTSAYTIVNQDNTDVGHGWFCCFETDLESFTINSNWSPSNMTLMILPMVYFANLNSLKSSSKVKNLFCKMFE